MPRLCSADRGCHVCVRWVSGCADECVCLGAIAECPTRRQVPALLLRWRQTPNGWEARVVRPVLDVEDEKWRPREEWLPAGISMTLDSMAIAKHPQCLADEVAASEVWDKQRFGIAGYAARISPVPLEPGLARLHVAPSRGGEPQHITTQTTDWLMAQQEDHQGRLKTFGAGRPRGEVPRFSSWMGRIMACVSGPFPCPCCGNLTYDEPPGSYQICEVCSWEDDHAQLRWPTLDSGPNGWCLQLGAPYGGRLLTASRAEFRCQSRKLASCARSGCPRVLAG